MIVLYCSTYSCNSYGTCTVYRYDYVFSIASLCGSLQLFIAGVLQVGMITLSGARRCTWHAYMQPALH